MESKRILSICLLLIFAKFSKTERCTPSSCFSSAKSPLYNPTPGLQFTYDFESTTTAQDKRASVSIRGQALISVRENCDFLLQLQNVIASNGDDVTVRIKDFTTYPLQFTLSGDELLPEICAENKDSTFSLNVKRGLISAFQNFNSKSSEFDDYSFGNVERLLVPESNHGYSQKFDIFGHCSIQSSLSEDKYTSSDNIYWNKITTIKQRRDLNNCKHRENFVNGLIQDSILPGLLLLPPLNGSIENEAKFENGILMFAEINEDYVLSNDLKAKVNTKLTLKRTINATTTNGLVYPIKRSIFFANTRENLASSNIKESIKSAFNKALNEFIEESGQISSPSTVTFINLVRLMRKAKRDDFLVSYQAMKSNTMSRLQSTHQTLGRSIFLNALFHVGSGDSIEALVDLSKKELTNEEIKLMYSSFKLVTTVTKGAIMKLTSLFRDNLPNEAYLSIGSIVSKYCRENGCDAVDIKPIADRFAAKIPRDCVVLNRIEENHLIAVLKGIRNSQTILNSALNTIISCVHNHRPNRVRIAALQAFTANSCNKKLQQAAIAIMKNQNEDNEIRIEAYLAAVHCPNGQLVTDIQEMLDMETNIHVGTFVITHIDSIKTSNDSNHEFARDIFQNLHTNGKFSSHSSHYSFKDISVSTYDIISQNSSALIIAKLKINPDFEFPFNFFELSLRQHNFDEIIENYYSREEGFLLNKFFDDINRKFLSSQNREQFEFDNKRSIDLSLKVFGNELFFFTANNFPSTSNEFIEFIASKLRKGAESLKDFNYNFDNHPLMFDFDIVYPTALGIPLKTSYILAITGKLNLAGSIDVMKIIKNPMNSKILLQLNTDLNIMFANTFGFNSYAFESYYETTAKYLTNTSVNMMIELQNGTNLEMKMNTTKENDIIAKMIEERSLETQESGRESVKSPILINERNQSGSKCLNQVDFFTGGEICLAQESTSQSNKFAIRMKTNDDDGIKFRTEFNMSEYFPFLNLKSLEKSFSSEEYENQSEEIVTTVEEYTTTTTTTEIPHLDTKCGIVELKSPIFLGFNTTPSYHGQFPWLAPLFHAQLGYVCGSSIITEWHLLTAAHCVISKATDYHTLIGRFDLTNSSELHWIARNMSNVFVHEDFNKTSNLQRSNGDIAVFRVSEKIRFSSYIRPVCLPKSETNVINVNGAFAGYGKTDIYGSHQNTPGFGNLKSISGWECLFKGLVYGNIVSERSFCAGSQTSITCQGDSGGGYYVYDQATQQHTTIGVVSIAIGLCNPKDYVAFVDVTKYINWINEKINISSSDIDAENPCNEIDCGENSDCKIVNEKAQCFCLAGHFGSPPYCGARCSLSSDCSNDRACLHNICTDLCLEMSMCDENVQCVIKNHRPRCIQVFD